GRSGVAPHQPLAGALGGGGSSVRGRGAEKEWYRLCGGAAALPFRILHPHLLRRLFGRILRVHVERSVGPGYGTVDAPTRRPDASQWRLSARQDPVARP